MSNLLREFTFEKPPKEITYLDNEPLKLTKEFVFFHNKSKFRKELNRLQYLFKSYTRIPLKAEGIRDSYLKEELSETFFMVLFTTSDIVKKTNKILKNYSDQEFESGCFLIEATSNYLLLLTKEIDSLISGINLLEEILIQILEDYINQQNFDEYIKIRPFKLKSC
ncbi:MAG: hypothetical protein ACFFB0_18635 [Promethearchaeota archaeon]